MADTKQYTSRRKSCEQCVKSKRRCDTSHPCRRCCQRALDCHYPSFGKSPSEKNLDKFVGPGKTLINGVQRGDFIVAHYTAPMYDTLATIVTYQLSKSSLIYCVRQIQSCIPSLVTTSETPFIKQSTWTSTDFSPMQEAFSIAASYNCRNSQNEDMVHAVILKKSAEIFRNEYWSFEEHLAAIQAMIILQIIQLFDGDIRLRAVAENRRIVLQDQILRLQQRQDYEIPVEVESSPWHKWVFLESVRRTVVAYWHVEAIYGALKNGFCDLVPLLATLPLAVNGKMWNAASELEWEGFSEKSRTTVLPYAEAMPFWSQYIKKDGNLEALQDALYVACKGNPELTFE